MTIAEKIRKMLLNIDLMLLEAKSEYLIAVQQVKVNSQVKSDYFKKLALEAKVKRESYKLYIKNLEVIKQEILNKLNDILSVYSEEEKEIWKLYFLEEKPIEEIAKKFNYTTFKVEKIIKKLKGDLKNYEIQM